jgi:CheY-like chemotaxis protein
VKKNKFKLLIEKIYISFIEVFKSKEKRDNNSKNIDKSTSDFKVKKTIKRTLRERAKAPISFDKINALVVEDNAINRKMMQLSLKTIGISSDIAENGRVGYEMRIKNRYDIIFMDVQMPVMDGIEATKAILEYEERENQPHVPIIAVTANALMGDREYFIADGEMDEYISKPIDLNQFITIIKEFFPEIESTQKNDILLYKQTPIEAKIVVAMLKKLGYSICVADNIDDFKKEIDSNSHHTILLDRVKSDTIHKSISQQIRLKSIPSLLFVDERITVLSSDREIYTHVTDKLTDFNCIKEKVESMMVE